MNGGRSSNFLFSIELGVLGGIAIVIGKYVGGYYGGVLSGIGLGIWAIAIIIHG